VQTFNTIKELSSYSYSQDKIYKKDQLGPGVVGAVDVGLYNTGPSQYGFSRIELAAIGHSIEQFYFVPTQK